MTAPGWYPDGAGRVRFWDGRGWTSRTSVPLDDVIGRDDPSELPPPADDAQPVQGDVPTREELVGGVALLGLAVGTISVFLPFIVGLVGGIVGLALSVAGTAQRGGGRWFAVAGIVVSVLAILLIG